MTVPPGWSAQKLAEFLAAVSSYATEAAAALGAVERVAESLDAEVAAIVARGRLVAAIGYAEGTVPVAELDEVARGTRVELTVPGAGPCTASVVPLEHPPDGRLVVARSGSDALSTDEASLLQGMARVASMTLRMLRLLDDERAMRKESERHAAEKVRLLAALTEHQKLLEEVAEEQAALRRVAILVAGGAAPTDVFAAVAEEIAELFGVPFVGLFRCEPDQSVTTIATSANRSHYLGRTWSRPPIGHGVLEAVLRTGKPARVDDYAELPGNTALAAEQFGVGAGVGVPVVVDGRVWGVVTIAVPTGHQPISPNAVDRLTGFTELIATSISNTQARAEVMRLAEEQAALRRVATRVAQGVEPSAVFTCVAEEIARISHVDNGLVLRFEPDGTATVVANSGSADIRMPVNSNWSLEGDSVTAQVFRTGRPARMDGYGHASGSIARALPGIEFSSVGAPIVIGGRLWGVAGATSATRPDARLSHAAATGLRRLPPDAEERIANFADLIATAISNADARAQLTASRARVVAAADDARRKLERDLHDGVQQRLVSLVLTLRSAEEMVPPDEPELQAQFARLGEGLTGVLNDLHEISRGIHPAILSEGGLGPALKALTRRSTVAVALDMRIDRRLPERVEVAAYYVVSEALTNAAKHAKASLVNVEVDATDDRVRLSIRDDGIGGAELSKGSGLIGLEDRVAALGGSIEITSPPGSGTSLLVTLPAGVAPP